MKNHLKDISKHFERRNVSNLLKEKNGCTKLFKEWEKLAEVKMKDKSPSSLVSQTPEV